MSRSAAPSLLLATALSMTPLLGATTAVGAPDETKILLHAIPHDQLVHCYVPQEMGFVDPATQTVTSVAGGSEISVFVYLVDYESAKGVGLRLVWPLAWEYFGWVGDCQSVQMTLTDLVPGSLDVATAFDLVTGGDLLPLGFASFLSGPTGEVGVEGTPWCDDDGICYLDADLNEIPIERGRVGWVAAGGAGFNPAAPLPVAPTTWGDIKIRYQAGADR